MKKTKHGQCRIIAGKWRGRKIKFNDAEGLRPTTDRIRETVFNWLQPYIQKSVCLDVFAGSGVLGFEALSRGADRVEFLENNIETVKYLKQNIRLLDAVGVNVFHVDALNWLRCVPKSQCYNLVFLDPPFHSDLLSKSSVILNNSGCLAEDAIIYVEHAADVEMVWPENWACRKEKRAGQVVYKIFETSKHK